MIRRERLVDDASLDNAGVRRVADEDVIDLNGRFVGAEGRGVGADRAPSLFQLDDLRRIGRRVDIADENNRLVVLFRLFFDNLNRLQTRLLRQRKVRVEEDVFFKFADLQNAAVGAALDVNFRGFERFFARQDADAVQAAGQLDFRLEFAVETGFFRQRRELVDVGAAAVRLIVDFLKSRDVGFTSAITLAVRSRNACAGSE